MITNSNVHSATLTPEEFLSKHGPEHWYHNYTVWSDQKIFTSPEQTDKLMRGQDSLTTHGVVDVTGKRVLDIGAFAGGFSFALEDMGAKVTSLDIMSPYLTGYAPVHHLRQSQNRYYQESIYTLNPEQYGLFDIVWFTGVLYHLKHPLIALERINSVMEIGGVLSGSTCSSEGWPDSQPHPHASGTGYDSQVDNEMGAALAYFKTKSIGSWFSPNAALVANWFKVSGFSIERIWCSRRNDLTPPVSWVHYCARKVAEPTPEYQASHLYEGFTGTKKKESFDSTPYSIFYDSKPTLKYYDRFEYTDTIDRPTSQR